MRLPSLRPPRTVHRLSAREFLALGAHERGQITHTRIVGPRLGERGDWGRIEVRTRLPSLLGSDASGRRTAR
jgi:hypothetical protein